MSIEDRDWIREQEPSGFSFGRLPPILTIVAATTVAFIVQSAVANGSAAGSAFIDRHLALSARAVLDGEVWQPATYLLLHGGLGHLFWNMVALWAFGSILAEITSDRGLWVHYLLGGLAGAVACVLWSVAVPGGDDARVIGASGAVMAVLVAAALRDPRRPVHLLLVPMPIPLWLLGAIYVALDVIGAVLAWTQGPTGVVAFQAHLGGAVLAVALFLAGRRGGGARPPAPRRARREAFEESNVLQPVGPPAAEAAERDRVEARVDALLERIHASGMGSLSAEEREFLKRASERYRDRRP